MAQEARKGIYRLKRAGGLLGAGKLVLSDAVPPCVAPPCAVPPAAALPNVPPPDEAAGTAQGGSRGVGAAPASVSAQAPVPAASQPAPPQTAGPASAPASAYGWVVGAHPAPRRNDRYLVEFLSETEYRLLAYADRYGRAFSTDAPFAAPPAREPDVELVDDAKQPEAGVRQGSVQVRDADGTRRQVAQYRCAKGRYELFDSWYDFGAHAQNLTYDQALARCYFAFVHRPALCGVAVPDSGLEFVFRSLLEGPPLAAMRGIVCKVRSAERDAAMRPPALARCVADWLVEAGLDEVLAATGHAATDAAGDFGQLGLEELAQEHGSEPLRLVQTARYADTFYLGVEDESAAVSPHHVWALEAALNRFLLITERLVGEEALADEAKCAFWDTRLRETIALQAYDILGTRDAEQAKDAGEWQLREHMGTVMEKLRLPFRFAADMRADVAAGVAAFDVTAPDAGLMPRRRWNAELARWVEATDAERELQALRYAERLGLALAMEAFYGAGAIERVVVTARPLQQDVPWYQVEFPRAALVGDASLQAVSTNPAALFASCGAVFGADAACAAEAPFAAVEKLPSAAARRSLPEVGTVRLSAAEQEALGARTPFDLRISYDAVLRHAGEQAAEAVVRTQSAIEAIRAVRAMQDETDEPLVYEACTRLMTALAEGSVDAGDQNALVARFLGEDPFAAALARARAAAKRDPAEAASLLAEVIAEAEASLRFADNAETVHRMFDSYAARVVYNVTCAREGADAGKRVELLPATLLLCYLESVRLLEESFAHADEALRCGMRCMEAAPTFSAAFRQTARAYMLVGDLESAAASLATCLRRALQPEEIAIAYYQLAYVEWKAGRLDAGVACYLKSIMTSPVFGAQSTVELQELLRERGARLLPRDEVDAVLGAAGIPVAPQEGLLDHVDAAIRASVDAGVFAVARSLLALRLHYRPDDALVNVLRSLEVPALQ